MQGTKRLKVALDLRLHGAAEQRRLNPKLAAATATANGIFARGESVPGSLKRFIGERRT